jgi:hypothetical protein
MSENPSGQVTKLPQRWVKGGERPDVLVLLDYLKLRRLPLKSGSAAP